MITDLFKTPMYLKDNALDNSDLFTLHEKVLDLNTRVEPYSDPYNVDIFKVSRPLTKNCCRDFKEQFSSISERIMFYGNDMLLQMGFSKKQLSTLHISGSWSCMYKDGDFLPMHIHRNVLIVFALYIDVRIDTSLRIYNFLYEDSPFPEEINNEWFKNHKDIPCISNRLLGIKGNQVHGHDKIKTNEKDVVKTMMAFNLKLKS